jgi:hypothetical protein
MFVKNSKIVHLMKNGHQHVAEEEIEKKNSRILKMLRGLVHQYLGNWIRFMLTKVEIHIISKCEF